MSYGRLPGYDFWCYRLPCSPSLTKPQIFCKEVLILARLTHTNIVPLLGVTINPPQLISKWMAGGQLPEYVEKHPSADILRLVGVPPLMFIPPSLALPVF